MTANCLFRDLHALLPRLMRFVSQPVVANLVGELTDSIENVSRADLEAAWYCVPKLMVQEWNAHRFKLLVAVVVRVFEENLVGLNASG